MIGTECPVTAIFADGFANSLLPQLLAGEALGPAMLAVPPPIAAAASVVIVRKFLMPAGEEVCLFRGEQLDEA